VLKTNNKTTPNSQFKIQVKMVDETIVLFESSNSDSDQDDVLLLEVLNTNTK